MSWITAASVLAGAALLIAGCSVLPLSGATKPPMTADDALGARNTDTSAHTPVSRARATSLARDGLVYVTYGQSNATNAGALGFDVSGPVYMVFRGRAYPYADPTLGGTGPGGTVWGRLGTQQVAAGAGAAFYANAGFGAATMQELAAPPHVDHLVTELRATKAALGHIDAVLIHQGESNNRAMRGPSNYRDAFESLLAQIRTVTDAPVYLSQATICGNESDTRLLALQDRIIRETPGVLRGPNTDTLSGASDRLPDRCHFSAKGLDKFAGLWAEALDRASEQ